MAYKRKKDHSTDAVRKTFLKGKSSLACLCSAKAQWQRFVVLHSSLGVFPYDVRMYEEFKAKKKKKKSNLHDKVLNSPVGRYLRGRARRSSPFQVRQKCATAEQGERK